MGHEETINMSYCVECSDEFESGADLQNHQASTGHSGISSAPVTKWVSDGIEIHHHDAIVHPAVELIPAYDEEVTRYKCSCGEYRD